MRWSELRRRRVPSAIADLIVDGGVKATDALAEMEARRDKLVLVLAGNPGCGKTVAACTRLQERSSGQLIRATELVELSSDWGDRHKVRELRSTGVLVLDDLGVEYRDAKMASRLDDILDARISAKLPTVITTNLTGSVFETRYGARVWSRLGGHGAYVELDAEDMRLTPIGSGRRGK
jgi:DNA replication protein DnaC